MAKNPIEIELPAERLKDIIHLVRSYSDKMEVSSWDFTSDGLLIYSGDKDAVSLLVVAVGPEWFKKYKVPELVELELDKDELDNIHKICREAEDTMIQMHMTESKGGFTFKYNNITKKTRIANNEDRTHKNYAPAKNVYPKSAMIGQLEISELKLFLRASATWKGEAERITKIVKNANGNLEMVTEIREGIDEVVFDLTGMDKKYRGETLEMLLQSSKLNATIKNVAPMTDKITLRGNTDFPLIMMAEDQDPNEIDFEEDFNFWYLLAPRIESE